LTGNRLGLNLSCASKSKRAALAAAIIADAADFGAGDRNFDAAIVGDLTFQLLEEAGLEFSDFAAAQAGDVDVIARSMGFVVMLIAAEMEEIEFVDQAMALQEIEGAIDSDAMDMGIDALRALEDFVGGEVALGAVHHLKEDAPLTREADAFFGERSFQAAGARIDVNAFSGTDAMCGAGRHGEGLALCATTARG
jgi:hypothetical protein